jgi:ComF family protein
MVYGILGRLFVESCLGCGEASPRGLCAVCAAELVRVRNPCPRCGLEGPVARCPRLDVSWEVDSVVAPFRYEAPLDHYLHALKFRGARHLGRALALTLVPTLDGMRGRLDALVAVPLHRKRLLERGYNQAQELAVTLARELALPALERGIVRPAAAAPQTGQGASRRRAAVAGAFRVERDLAGLRIGIVDDVVTTGATVNALAAELRAAGAARCVVLAVARTAEPAQGRNV